jgi:hypothetical protein
MEDKFHGWVFGAFRNGLPYAQLEPLCKFYFEDNGDLICDTSFVPFEVVEEVVKRHRVWKKCQEGN